MMNFELSLLTVMKSIRSSSSSAAGEADALSVVWTRGRSQPAELLRYSVPQSLREKKVYF